MTLRSFMHIRFWVMPYHFKWFKHWSKRTNGITSLTCLSKQQTWRRLKPIAIFVIGNLLAQQFFVVHFCCLLSVWYNAWAERYLFDTTLWHYLQNELDNCDTAPSIQVIWSQTGNNLFQFNYLSGTDNSWARLSKTLWDCPDIPLTATSPKRPPFYNCHFILSLRTI